MARGTTSTLVLAIAIAGFYGEEFGRTSADGAQATTVIAVTDGSWSVTPTAPATDWEALTTFDDSAWEPATEMFPVGAGYSAEAIWSSGGQYSSAETEIWARKVVNLAALPQSAVLTGGFDDDGELYVNGQLVWVENNGEANAFSLDITPYLVVGDNLVAFHAYDNWPVFGYNHQAWIQIDATFPAGVISNCNDAGLATLTTVTGNLIVTDPTCTLLSMPALTSVSGDMTMTGNPTLTTVSAPTLVVVGGDMGFSSNPVLTSVDLPGVQSISGDFIISDNGNMTNISMPTLTTVGGDMTFSSNPSLVTTSLPSLTAVGEGVTMTGNPSLSDVFAPTLTTVGGDMSISGGVSLTTVSMPALENVGGDFDMTTPSVSLAMPALDVSGNAMVTGSGASGMTMQTADGSTNVTLVTGSAVISLAIPDPAYAGNVPFSLQQITGAGLTPQPGVEGADPVVVDPVVAYQFTFAIPTLGADATVNFTIALGGLSPADASALVAAVGAGGASLAVKGDLPTDTYQVYAVCASDLPPSTICAQVRLLDAAHQPTTDPSQAAFVEVAGLTGHFSSFAVVLVAPATSDTHVDVTLGDLLHTYSGTAKAASATTTPSGIALTLTYSQDGAPVAAPTNAGTYHVVATINQSGYEGGGEADLVILPASLTITAQNKSMILNGALPALTASYSGFVGGDGPGSLDTPVSLATTATGSSVGTFPIAASQATDTNYAIGFVPGSLTVSYASTGLCLGAPGHQVLQPLNIDGSSIVKRGSTVPVKFRACDALGQSVSTAGVVLGFVLSQVLAGDPGSVNEAPLSNTPDTAFRWSPADQLWIFNLDATLPANQKYQYRITLGDGSVILFQFAVK